jgi:hypothetical protein
MSYAPEYVQEFHVIAAQLGFIKGLATFEKTLGSSVAIYRLPHSTLSYNGDSKVWELTRTAWGFSGNRSMGFTSGCTRHEAGTEIVIGLEQIAKVLNKSYQDLVNLALDKRAQLYSGTH